MPQTNTEHLVSKLQNLRQLVGDLSDTALLSHIDGEIQKLQASRFHLAVLGQFKRGKTTFINALLGEELLPIGVVPVTSVVTLIEYGSETQCEVLFSNNVRLQITPAQLPEYVTEEGNPENRKGVRYVEIRHSSPFLEEGIVLVDTPGVGSLYSRATETTQAFIPHVDAAIVVLSADLPVTSTEYQFLDDVAEHVRKLFFVLNKSDLLSAHELEDAVAYTRKVLKEKKTDEDVAIMPLSARNALCGEKDGDAQILERSNLPAFKQILERFARAEKQAVLYQRSHDRVSRLVAETRFTTELQLKAATLPLADLQSKIDQFGKQIALLKDDRRSFGHLLNGELSAFVHSIEEQLNEFASAEIKILRSRLSEWAAAHAHMPARELQAQIHSHLSTELINDFDRWRREKDREIVDGYDSIVSRFVEKTNEFIRRALQISAHLFEMDLQVFQEVPAMEWKRTFYYKLEDDPTFLEFDPIKVGSVVLPAATLRKRIFKNASADVEDKVNRHCGRLRYDYEYSIQESYRKFQFELNEKIETVINEIHTTLEAARQMRNNQETTIASHLGKLQDRLQKLLALQSDREV